MDIGDRRAKPPGGPPQGQRTHVGPTVGAGEEMGWPEQLGGEAACPATDSERTRSVGRRPARSLK